MPIKIKFDSERRVVPFTLVLATRSGNKINAIPYHNLVFSDALNEASEFSCRINKKDCKIPGLWQKIVDFKCVWIKDLDRWYEITVSVDEADSTIKNISGMHLAESELSQINLNLFEANTEDDILRDDYEPTVLYNPEKPNASLLHRMLSKAPQFTIGHVDSSLANIQRTFSFSEQNIYDALQEVSEELDCVFIFKTESDKNGRPVRTIEAYDLEDHCIKCKQRDKFDAKCSDGGEHIIAPGYGHDTPVYISVDNAADEIGYSVDAGSVKNCFWLTAGDDLMTATVANCNPNGTRYIWNITDKMMEDMSPQLKSKLNEYNNRVDYYQSGYSLAITSGLKNEYNAIVTRANRYRKDDEKFSQIGDIKGYPKLMEAYYDAIDLAYFLRSSMMPTVTMASTSAVKEAAKIKSGLSSGVAVKDISVASKPTVDSAVLAYAKAICDTRYKIQITESTYTTSGTTHTWKGKISVTNYSAEEDTATTDTITCTIGGDYEKFIRQKIDIVLAKSEANEETDIAGLFKIESDTTFEDELKKYSLNRLISFHDACQACIDIMIEGNVASTDTSQPGGSAIYDNIYKKYYDRLGFIEAEMKVRDGEIDTVIGKIDEDGTILQDGVKSVIDKARNTIKADLDLESRLGSALLTEFASYRRDDVYSNDNYISDGLNNAELFAKALEFVEAAKKEIEKSASYKHQITSTLKNLFTLKGFEKIVDDFQVGNFIRVRADGEVYRLRLLRYEIDFENLATISVDFSDADNIKDNTKNFANIIAAAASIATTYDYVAHQAKQGSQSKDTVDSWIKDGLSATKTKIVNESSDQTQVWDSHGMLFRKQVGDEYDAKQMKIINSTLAITKDNWQSVATAIGEFSYVDPSDSNKIVNAFGVNGEVIVGKLILGQLLRIVNDKNTMSFDDDGLKINVNEEKAGKNNKTSFAVNPNENQILKITNKAGEPVFYFDVEANQLVISGDGSDLILTNNNSITDVNGKYNTLSEGVNTRLEAIGLTNAEVDAIFAEVFA